MKYQVQENCLTIFLPEDVDHHNAEEIKREADDSLSTGSTSAISFLTLRTPALWTAPA